MITILLACRSVSRPRFNRPANYLIGVGRTAMLTAEQSQNVTFVDLNSQHAPIREELDQAIREVVDSCAFIRGKYTESFEQSFAKYVGVKHCVGMGNGTDALYVALMALGVTRGDEVITAANSFIASSEAITQTGARVVFVDCDPHTYTIDTHKLENAITKKTKAIMPVHLYGRMCKMKQIKEIADRYDLYLIEDCAQSAIAGDLYGHVGCYSFYPTKNLGGVGDGGCVITDDKDIANKARRLREYGYYEKFVSYFMGINSRLDEIQAAVLNVKLKYLPDELQRRWKLAKFYTEQLEDTKLLLPEMEGVFHQYVVRCDVWYKRDELVKLLGAQIHYPIPCHLQPAYIDEKKVISLPITEKISKEILSLPMRISIKETREVCKKIKEVL